MIFFSQSIAISTLTILVTSSFLQTFVSSFSTHHPSSNNIQRRLFRNELERKHRNQDSYYRLPSKKSTRLNSFALIDFMYIPTALEEVSSAYTYALENYQIQTHSLSTGVLTGLGDTIAQWIEVSKDEQKRKIQLQRTLNFALKGLGAGVIWHTWYNIADICGDFVFGDDHAIACIPRTLLCVGLEQFVACPIVFALWDIPVPALLGGSTLKEIPSRVEDRLGGLLFSNAKVWTIINMVIYNIPTEWRVLAMNFAELGWQVIVSKTIMGDGDGIAKQKKEISEESIIAGKTH